MKLREALAFTALLFGSIQSAWAEIRVAVMPFDNAGGDEFEQLGLGLQSMVTTDLSQVEEVKVVERGKLQALIGEMELATTGVVDPVTAAKLGKVAGATHVVAGSFTVVGAQMRLDARLVNVQSGEAVGVSADGEKEAFFELQKDMVKELLKVIGAELSPKERAAIGRIHTADFESFSDFSKGVALFDANRYDEALAVLKEVSERDSMFALADVTAEQVADAQKRASEKAMAARVTEAEAKFVAHQESARWEAEQFAALRKVAFDPQAEMADRVAAATNLVVLTRRVNTGGYHELRYVSDNFALARVGDRAYQVIWALLDPEVPRWFPRFKGTTSPNQERGWDAAHVVKTNRENLFESTNRYKHLADCSLAWTDRNGVIRSLWLPTVQLYDAYATQLRKALKCDGIDPAKIRDEERELAEAYKQIGEIAKATALLDRQSDETADADELEDIARTLAEVKERAEIIEKATSPEAKELAKYAQKFWESDLEDIPHFLHYRLRREFPLRDPFFLADLPMWLLSRGKGLGSGPRSGWDTSRSLRHYGDVRADWGFDRTLGSPDVVTLLGTQVGNGTLSVDLIWKPTAEWHPHLSRDRETFTLLDAKPRAGILVGMADLETPATCDPVNEKDLTQHPLTAIAAYADGEQLVIGRLVGAPDDSPSCRSTRRLEAVTVEPLAKQPLKKADGTLSVTVKGKTVTAKLGKASVTWSAPEDIVGFVGLYAEGEGYVELSEPRWKP